MSFWGSQELRQVFLNLGHILLVVLQCSRSALAMIVLLGVESTGLTQKIKQSLSRKKQFSGAQSSALQFCGTVA